MQDLLLGLDIGTSSVKGVIIDRTGKIVAQAEATNDLVSKHIGWAEQLVDHWEQNIIGVIKSCLSQSEISPQYIRCIGVSGMVPALILLDLNGNVLRPAIQYNDSRSVQQIQFYVNQIGSTSFFDITGAELSVQSVGPKLGWVRKNEPDIWKNVAWVMGSYDYINYFLTGEISVERNWALESGLFDIHQQCWSKKLLAEFDLPENILPPIKTPMEIAGYLRTQISQTTGLIQGTPVISGSADHVAAALAAGITQPGDVLIKFGSSGDLLYCADHAVLNPHFYIDFHCLPNRFLPNGCMSTSGSLLKWYVNGFCQQDKVDAQTKNLNIYEYLDNQVENLSPGSAGLVVLPYFLGAKTPLNNPAARGAFYGLTLSHTRHHIYRAIMESVVYGFRDHFEILDELELPITRVVASEGGARSLLWRQIAADILNKPIGLVEGNPGSAFGVAILAGMAMQIIRLDDFTRNKEVNEISIPNPEFHKQYQASYQKYKLLYEQLKPVFNEDQLV